MGIPGKLAMTISESLSSHAYLNPAYKCFISDHYTGARGIVPSVMDSQSGYDTLPILNRNGELGLQPLSNNDVDRLYFTFVGAEGAQLFIVALAQKQLEG